MRVAFLYNRSTEDPAHAAEDEVPARSPVVGALKHLGHRVVAIACTLDLAEVRHRLLSARPDVVFNRVESLGGSDAMMAGLTLLLDSMRIPYTGNSTAALVATASKVSVKRRLQGAGLPTPAWLCVGVEAFDKLSPGDDPARCNQKAEITNAKYIIKSVDEHASFEIDDASVIRMTSREQIEEVLRDRAVVTGREHFAEEFIEGREFNLSLLGAEPRVLPPAEIDFSAFPRDKERIVGRHAKCDATTFEYHNTPRRFDFPASDGPLLQRLSDLAVDCWRLFDLCGYARVDSRVDALGQPWILEINTNPCISPGAGFVAAMDQAALGYDDGIQYILDEALARVRAVPRLNDNLSYAEVINRD